MKGILENVVLGAATGRQGKDGKVFYDATFVGVETSSKGEYPQVTKASLDLGQYQALKKLEGQRMDVEVETRTYENSTYFIYKAHRQVALAKAV